MQVGGQAAEDTPGEGQLEVRQVHRQLLSKLADLRAMTSTIGMGMGMGMGQRQGSVSPNYQISNHAPSLPPTVEQELHLEGAPLAV